MKYCLELSNNNKTIDISSPIRTNRSKLFSDNTIISNDPKWGENLRSYKKLRDIFHYESKVFPKHITTKMINDSHREFNPITQKYYNEEKEKNILENSKKK